VENALCRTGPGRLELRSVLVRSDVLACCVLRWKRAWPGHLSSLVAGPADISGAETEIDVLCLLCLRMAGMPGTCRGLLFTVTERMCRQFLRAMAENTLTPDNTGLLERVALLVNTLHHWLLREPPAPVPLKALHPIILLCIPACPADQLPALLSGHEPTMRALLPRRIKESRPIVLALARAFGVPDQLVPPPDSCAAYVPFPCSSGP
jgi:hypothetical protein